MGRLTIHIKCACFLALLLAVNAVHGQDKAWGLKACIARALQENIALNQGMASNEANAINYEQARANALPNLNLNGQHALNSGHSVNYQTAQSSNDYISSGSLSLTSNLTLYNGLKNVNLIRQNKLYYDAGIQDIEKMKNDLTLNVIAAYMQVLFQYEAINVAQAQVDATNEHLKYTAIYVKAGSLPESNLLQMQAQLATDKAAKVDAENQLQVARVTLMQLMELPVTPGFDIERPEQKEPEPEITQNSGSIYDVAAGFLPEVKSAAIKTKAAETGLNVARAALMPKLTLGGNLSTSYSSAYSLVSYQTITGTQQIGYLASNPAETVNGTVSNTISNSASYPFFRQVGDNFGQGLTLNLLVPIFNNHLYRNDIRKSGINIRVARLNEKLVNNQLRKAVEIAYTDQVAAAKNYIATREQLTSEEASYHNITIKFKAGAINTTDFFVEKTIYNKARLAHLQAKYQYLFKTKIVNFYLNNPITD